MVVDRGGLRYPIEVVDRFAATLTAFRQGVREGRQEMALFRRTIRKLGTDSANISQAARATLELARNTRALTSAQSKASATGAAQAKSKILSEKQILALQRARLSTVKAIISTQAAGKALQRQCLALDVAQRRETERTAAAKLRAAAAQRKAAVAQIASNQRALSGTKGLNKALKKTESTANRISFTFRRLFGILAAFTAARLAVQGFAQLIAGGVKFNQQIAQSRIGIAGLIVAVADIVDEQGNLVTGAEAFTLATAEAGRQQRLLRQDSLKTVATFQELNKTFQVAVAPGIVAGLRLDEIRNLAVRVTQAASALDVPLNQLSEEIRALLTGNITGRTTRIATALGITPEDIRSAERMGNLAEFLEERFATFGKTAEAVAKTLLGTFARLRGVFQELTATAADPLVKALTKSLQGLIEKLTTISEIDGQSSIILRPEAVEALSVLFSSIASAVDTVGSAIAATDFSTLTDAAEFLGQILEGAAGALTILVTGAIRGFGTLGNILAPIIDLFSLLNNALSGELLTTVVQIGVVFVGLQLSIKLISVFTGVWFKALKGVHAIALLLKFAKLDIVASMGFIVDKVRAWAAQSKIVAATMLVIKSRAFLIAAGIGAITLAILGTVQGAGLLLGTLLDIESLTFKNVFDLLKAGIGRAIDQTVDAGAESSAALARVRKDLALLEKDLARQKVNPINFLADPEKNLKAQKDAIEFLQNQIAAAKAQEKLLLQELGVIRKQDADDEDSRANDVIERIRAASEERIAAAKRLAAVVAGQSVEGGKSTQEKKADKLQQDELDAFEKSKRQLAIDQAKLRLLQISAGLTRNRTDAFQKQLDISKEQGRVEEAQVASKVSTLNIEIALQKQVLSTTQGEEAQVQRNDQINRLLAQRQILLEGLAINKDVRIFEQEQLDQLANGTFFDGISEGFSILAAELPTEFERGLEIMKQAVEGFASFLSTSLVDAFSGRENTIKQRFGQLLANLAASLAESALLSIIGSIFAPGPAQGLDFAANPGLFGPGFAKGGKIKGSRKGDLAHHINPRGLHTGGATSTAPAGLHHTDTIPIWAAEGEFMMKVAAVKKYGLGFMSKLNAGLLDPSSLPALGAATGRNTIRRATGPGYAHGGEIVNTQNTTVDLPVAGGGAPTVLPVFPVRESEMETLLAGGEATMIQFMRDHADEAGINSSRGQ